MRKKILITAALPYANGPLHFGHIAGAYLPADCYARFERLRGKDVLFICGSDEYGVAITLSAEQAGRSPKEHVDIFHKVNHDFFKKLNISFDHFSRTTHEHHNSIVQEFFLDLLKNGHIEERETEELFSEKEGKFLADRYVVGTCPKCHFEKARGDECIKCGASYEAINLINPYSKLSGLPLIKRKTRHYFLLFDHFKNQLTQFLESRPWKSNVINFAKPYIQEIHARAISRDLKWGVPIPLEGAEGKVFYVWFDAPIGYISATQEWARLKAQEKDWEKYWLDPQTKYVQFMGKDNIPFHALFFPAMIMGQDKPYKLVDELVANEFYNLEGRQFSKSEGWIIDLEDFFNHYHADQIRYMIAVTAPETADSEFSWKEFQARCNGDLVGKYGNLVNRVLVFLHNNCDGKIPEASQFEEIDHRFINDMNRLGKEIEEEYSSFHLRKACSLLMELAHKINAYFDIKAPWKDAKDENRRHFMGTTLKLCLEGIKNLALFSYPIIPETAQKVWDLLALGPITSWKEGIEKELETNVQLPKPYIICTKIEDEMIEQEIAKLQKSHSEATNTVFAYPPLKEMLNIDDVQKLDLRVGKIIQAEKLPKSKKLLKLEVDLGFEKRIILSGISEHYSPETMVGKKVVVVANLKPAKLMGIESQGMILAATLDGALEVLTLQDIPLGASVS